MELFLPLILNSHNPYATGPYNWHMTCDRWQKRAVEIMEDDNLPQGEKTFLVNYLRGKVEGTCAYPPMAATD